MLWRTLPKTGRGKKAIEASRRYPSEPQENLLYFMEKNAPLLESRQREILRIVRKVSQYFFYPQKQTQVMNEGWATFWHYTILNHLYDEGKSDRALYAGVSAQPHQRGVPAALQQPVVQRDQPLRAGFRHVPGILNVSASRQRKKIATGSRISPVPIGWRRCISPCAIFKDESFISQFLSPKVMRDFRLFTVLDDDHNNYPEISAIHNEEGYREIRSKLSAQYNLSNLEPNIQVWNVDLRGDRSLTLRYVPHNRVPLDKSRREVLKHVHRLWGFDVILSSRMPTAALSCWIARRRGRTRCRLKKMPGLSGHFFIE